MQIKFPEGQTLLTFIRVALVIVACLCVGPAYNWCSRAFSVAASAQNTVDAMLEAETTVGELGQPLVLYYSEAETQGGNSSVYQVYYKTGSEGAYGLLDAGGNRLLEDEYEDMLILPHAYVLKQSGSWKFYSRTDMAPLNADAWDQVEVLRDEDQRFASDLVCVGRGGLFGAVDMNGTQVIEPAYESFQLSSQLSDWPLIRVQQDGLYGFIDSTGQQIVSLTYDYAVLDTALVYADENDAEGRELPVIYVLRDGDWGLISRNEDGSSSNPDWSVDPTEEVLAAYQAEV